MCRVSFIVMLNVVMLGRILGVVILGIEYWVSLCWVSNTGCRYTVCRISFTAILNVVVLGIVY